MNYQGIIVGMISFICIGLFHPIVIKSEYYFTYKCYPFFGVVGILLLVISCFIHSYILSCLIAVIGFSSLWSILELFEQKERVAKGWFPANPNRKS